MPKDSTEDARTGTETLFERVIYHVIGSTPSPELRKNLYDVFDRVVRGHLDEDLEPLDVSTLSPEQTTAYRVLERAGYVIAGGQRAFGTEVGTRVHTSFRREGVFPEIDVG
jgi:hypothetical protein